MASHPGQNPPQGGYNAPPSSYGGQQRW